MKKLITLILFATILGSIGGCRAANKDGLGTLTTPTDAPTQPSTAPAVEPKNETITIAIPMNANVTDYDNNAYILWLERTTGYDLEILQFAELPGDYKTQVATDALVSELGQLPTVDMYLGFDEMDTLVWSGDKVGQQYEKEGYFIDLSQYMMDKEGKSKVWWDRAAGLSSGLVDKILAKISTDENHIYAFPTVTANSSGDDATIECASFITRDAENVDACWEILMAMSSEEGAFRQRYGEYGENWQWADSGAKAANGLNAKVKLLTEDIYQTSNAKCLNAMIATIITGMGNEFVQAD